MLGRNIKEWSGEMAYLGIADEDFIRGKVPMTKQEIRILTIAKARLSSEDVVYDIGAGTGALSVEAARQVMRGHVYALERHQEGVQLIRANAEKFQVHNLTVLETEAPAGIETLPYCDCVLIGGSGSRLRPILEAVDGKLRKGGRILLNCITIQTLSEAIDFFRAHPAGFRYETIQVQVNRLRQIGPYDMAQAQNPIYILCALKQDGNLADSSDGEQDANA